MNGRRRLSDRDIAAEELLRAADAFGEMCERTGNGEQKFDSGKEIELHHAARRYWRAAEGLGLEPGRSRGTSG